MALLDQDTVLTIFGDDIYGVREQLLGAWADYHAEYPERIKELNDRTTRANCVHSLAKDRLSRFAGFHSDRLRVAIHQRMFVLVVKDRLVCKIKKLDRLLKSSGIRTQNMVDFRRQKCLPGLPDSCNLEIGYQLDRAERQIASVHLVCPNDAAYYFAWEIEESEITTKVSDLFPIRIPVEQNEEDDAPLFVPKKDGEVIPFPVKRDATPTDDKP